MEVCGGVNHICVKQMKTALLQLYFSGNSSLHSPFSSIFTIKLFKNFLDFRKLQLSSFFTKYHVMSKGRVSGGAGGRGAIFNWDTERKAIKELASGSVSPSAPSSPLPTPSSLSPYIYTFFWAASNHTMSTVIYRN